MFFNNKSNLVSEFPPYLENLMTFVPRSLLQSRSILIICWWHVVHWDTYTTSKPNTLRQTDERWIHANRFLSSKATLFSVQVHKLICIYVLLMKSCSLKHIYVNNQLLPGVCLLISLVAKKVLHELGSIWDVSMGFGNPRTKDSKDFANLVIFLNFLRVCLVDEKVWVWEL